MSDKPDSQMPLDPTVEMPSAGGLDVMKRTFTTQNGVVFHLNPVSAFVLQYLGADESDRPQPPLIEVQYGNGAKGKERDVNDPAYQKELAAFEGKRQMRTMEYALNEGITENPPDEWVEHQRVYLPKASKETLKYLWIMGHFQPDEVPVLTEAILSMTQATPKGLEQSAARFRREGKRG
jgi:hypothetical protein